jgi:hypothetical protein
MQINVIFHENALLEYIDNNKNTTPSKYRIDPKSGRHLAEVIRHAASKILYQFK